MKLLNVACGNRYHKTWENIDFYSSSPDVKSVNILNGLPYTDNSFDVVYSSHFLEHLTKNQADFVLSEIFRILKKGGIIRLVVPDLENIAREYLAILSNLENHINKTKYEWIILELLDQLVRTESGGEMGKFFKNENTVNDDFLKEYIFLRVGERIIPQNKCICNAHFVISKINLNVVKNILLSMYLSLIKGLFPKSIRNSLILKTSIGERHLWMYDRYSLSEKLLKNGFKDIKFFSHNESQIPKFSDYQLDTNKEGTPYKGVSSLYCEAIKS